MPLGTNTVNRAAGSRAAARPWIIHGGQRGLRGKTTTIVENDGWNFLGAIRDALMEDYAARAYDVCMAFQLSSDAFADG